MMLQFFLKFSTILLCCLFLILNCSVRAGKQQSALSSVTMTSPTATDSKPPVAPKVPAFSPSPSDTPVYLSPAEWEGENFFVLPKQNLLRSSGYQLYSCKNGECDTATVDPAWELDNHRIRCEKIAGDPLYVENVEPDGDEWTITFFHEKSNRFIYGHTHKHAIAEIAFIDDRINAYDRWINKIIYSKKGVLATIGTNSPNSISSIRINIQDTLFVKDVKWGMTPLPVKPLWLMVKTTSGQKGFIPVRFSWTNTMKDMITGGAPWQEDIFEKNPASQYDWDDYTWEIINNHRVITEMTIDQVLLSWGKPLSRQSGNDNDDGIEILIYPSHELQFSQKKLVTITPRQPAAK